jgi:hypothetical protein
VFAARALRTVQFLRETLQLHGDLRLELSHAPVVLLQPLRNLCKKLIRRGHSQCFLAAAEWDVQYFANTRERSE